MSVPPPPVRVVVAGGGTAGWIAATALTRQLGRLVEVTLVESEAIGTVGVGEATIPTARTFHDYLKIDETAFMNATKATMKLGIAFEDWARPGDRYIHSFGTFGLNTWVADFQHFWLEARAAGFAADLGSYCAEHEAAREGRFGKDIIPPLNYAYHLDAGLYAAFLRRIAETDGAQRIEGRIAHVERVGDDIAALVLDDGRRIAGDLFIDCTGFRGLLIAETLGAGYEDWSGWLATNAALAVQTAKSAPTAPYTRAMAHTAGWQWRIPLRHRMGNGIVFASELLDPQQAQDRLLGSVDGEVLTEPRLIRYTTGRRSEVWRANCVALGLASGFVEPLESTSIHLIMIGVTRLIQQFPFNGATAAARQRYNGMARVELERVRDFIILHYRLNERHGEPFWDRSRTMALPDTLAERIASFQEQAQAWQGPEDLFRIDSWLQVMLGQRLDPVSWHRLPSLMSAAKLSATLKAQRNAIAERVAGLPKHQAWLDCNLAAAGDA